MLLFYCEHTAIMHYVFNNIMTNNRKNGRRPLYSWSIRSLDDNITPLLRVLDPVIVCFASSRMI
jgi:hypothetical protein